jgi:hypothetical protein
MKKIFTLLISLGCITAVFAQSGHNDKYNQGTGYNNQSGYSQNPNYQKPNDHYNQSGYDSHTSPYDRGGQQNSYDNQKQNRDYQDNYQNRKPSYNSGRNQSDHDFDRYNSGDKNFRSDRYYPSSRGGYQTVQPRRTTNGGLGILFDILGVLTSRH